MTDSETLCRGNAIGLYRVRIDPEADDPHLLLDMIDRHAVEQQVHMHSTLNAENKAAVIAYQGTGKICPLRFSH